MSSELYHISLMKRPSGIWTPRAPTGGGSQVTKYTEPPTSRISVSPTIPECFQAIYPNVSHLFEVQNKPYLDFYVYSAELSTDVVVVNPSELNAGRLVHDAHITREHWITTPCKMILRWRVRIMNTNKSPDLNYRPYNDKHEKLRYLAPKNIAYTVIKES